MATATTSPTTIVTGPGTLPPPPELPRLPWGGSRRLGSTWFNWCKALFGWPPQRRLAHAALQVGRVRLWEQEFSKLPDEEILRRGQQMRGRARGGESLDSLLPEVFGLVCVAAWRHLKLRPYDVQLAAGVLLHRGAMCEVATGEGKTLVAIAPAALNALVGKGVHVTTVNDYLARRDGELTMPVYNALGLSVGIIQQKMQDEERRKAYRADVTYATASELGFDFLRDRLKISGSRARDALPFWTPWVTTGNYEQPMDPKVQREHHFALVDEADNIFIDEAKTPLIISGGTRAATEEETVVYKWADHLALQMKRDHHFTLDEKKQKIELTDDGRTLVRYSNPPFGEHSHAMDKLHEHVERSLHAHHRFRLDQHYMIDPKSKKIVIIDEATGRPQPDRHWRDGLHQAVEAKHLAEGVQIQKQADHAAQVTFQSYFKLYKKLCGMSGTAIDNFWELLRVYKLWVVRVPTNKPIQRQQMPDRVFPNEHAKFEAVVAQIKDFRARGRPILVGTRSVERSEKLSRMLTEAGVPHQVLNARPENAEKEATIVAQAGRPGTVTIATNMAGRGTDIILGGNAESIAWQKLTGKYQFKHHVPPNEWQQVLGEVEAREPFKEQHQQVVAAGGLHVIGTERHEARRIDRQLAGRSGRQGDPGSAQFFLSLEDELLEGAGPSRQDYLKRLGQRGGNSNWQQYLSDFLRAQKRIERRHYRQRLDLVVYERNRQEILKDIGADPYVD